MQPELIAPTACHTGESPRWHAAEKKLYWLDIPAGRIYRYDPAIKTHELFYQGEVTGGMTIQEDGALLLFQKSGAIRSLKGGQLTTLLPEIPAERDSRFNDVATDPNGRVWAGTMSSSAHKGTLYRVEKDGTVTPFLRDVLTSNGMGFSLDNTRFYHTDTGRRTIFEFDYKTDNGVFLNCRELITVPDAPGEGKPDGMAMDAEGFIWSARWGGSCVVRYDPHGKEERRIKLPCRTVSSLTFGGEDFTDLYITTARLDHTEEEEGPGAGGLFRVNLGIKGRPDFLSRICLGG